MGFIDSLSGLGHGLVSLAGIGSVYDPMAELRGELSSSVSDMNNMVANETIGALQTEQTEIQALYTNMETHTEVMQSVMKENNAMIWDSLAEENIFIATLAVLVVLLVLFMLVQKNCC